MRWVVLGVGEQSPHPNAIGLHRIFAKWGVILGGGVGGEVVHGVGKEW
jgi:hypothetical protein